MLVLGEFLKATAIVVACIVGVVAFLCGGAFGLLILAALVLEPGVTAEGRAVGYAVVVILVLIGMYVFGSLLTRKRIGVDPYNDDPLS